MVFNDRYFHGAHHEEKMTPLTALVLVPVLIALVAGFGPELGKMMKEGVKEIALTGVMLILQSYISV